MDRPSIRLSTLIRPSFQVTFPNKIRENINERGNVIIPGRSHNAKNNNKRLQIFEEKDKLTIPGLQKSKPSKNYINNNNKTHHNTCSQNKRVIINVGGEIHDILWTTLEKIPGSRLENLVQLSSILDSHEGNSTFVDENSEMSDSHDRSHVHFTKKRNVNSVKASRILKVASKNRQNNTKSDTNIGFLNTTTSNDEQGFDALDDTFDDISLKTGSSESDSRISDLDNHSPQKNRYILNNNKKKETKYKPNRKFTKTKEHDNQLLQICDDYCLEKNEFYFDRDPISFRTIINFYRSNQLHMPDEICALSFAEEVVYWGVKDIYLESCCSSRYHSKKEQVLEEIQREIEVKENEPRSDAFVDKKFGVARGKMWKLLENPKSSELAKYYALISVVFIVASTLSLILATTEHFSTYDDDAIPHGMLFHIESICISWFTVEYLARLSCCPDIPKFLKQPLNIIDLLAILPHFSSVLFEYYHINLIDNLGTEDFNFATFKKSVSTFKILRVMRVLKLARHSTGLQSLGYTLQRSYNELGLLGMFMAITIIIFSSLVYFAERDVKNTKFTSIPQTFWWATITMTTVGYGDMYPQSTVGQIIGGICCVTGVLVIALPIPIIVNNFNDFYKEQKKKEKAAKRQEAIASLLDRQRESVHQHSQRHSQADSV